MAKVFPKVNLMPVGIILAECLSHRGEVRGLRQNFGSIWGRSSLGLLLHHPKGMEDTGTGDVAQKSSHGIHLSGLGYEKMIYFYIIHI